MRGISKYACLVSALGAMCVGCAGTNVSVGAGNGAVAAYPSSIGNVNTPQFALGDLVAVDAKTHRSWKFAAVKFDATDVAISQTNSETSEPFDSSFDLVYSKKLGPVIEDQVTETIRAQTFLHTENYFTRSIKNPGAFTAGSTQLAKAVLKLKAENPDVKAFLVTSITSAEKVYLTYEGPETNTTKVGKYTFHINYAQNDQLESLAKDAPAFFKLTALKVEESEGFKTVAVDKSAGEKLNADSVASLR